MSGGREYANLERVPDPTADHRELMCLASWRSYLCTAPTGHDGPHLAGAVDCLAAEWPNVEATS